MENTSKEPTRAPKQWTGAPIGNGQIGANGHAKERASEANQRTAPADAPSNGAHRPAHQRDVDGTRGSAASSGVPQSYDALESDFRGHHQSNAAWRRGPYEHYRLVYRYGYDLGADPRYRDADWAAVEQQARPRWEERNPGTWEQFKETIRYAWGKTRSWNFRM